MENSSTITAVYIRFLVPNRSIGIDIAHNNFHLI